MREAAERLGLQSVGAARELLKRNGVALRQLTPRLSLVSESDLAAFELRRRERGRPRKEKPE